MKTLSLTKSMVIGTFVFAIVLTIANLLFNDTQWFHMLLCIIYIMWAISSHIFACITLQVQSSVTGFGYKWWLTVLNIISHVIIFIIGNHFDILTVLLSVVIVSGNISLIASYYVTSLMVEKNIR